MSLYSEERQNLIDLLGILMGCNQTDDFGTDIEYFIYDLEYGTSWKENSITDDTGRSFDLHSPEALYDYLVESYQLRLNNRKEP